MTLVEAFRRNWLIATFGIILLLVGAGLLFWNEVGLIFVGKSGLFCLTFILIGTRGTHNYVS